MRRPQADNVPLRIGRFFARFAERRARAATTSVVATSFVAGSIAHPWQSPMASELRTPDERDRHAGRVAREAAAENRERPMSVRIEKRDRVTTVIIDRPHARNAIDPPTATLLAEAFRSF